MRQHRRYHVTGSSVFGFLAIWLALGNGLVLGQDPVDELRQALSIRPEDRRVPSEAILRFRREALQKAINNLKTIGDLRRALVEWKEDINLSDKVQRLDEEMRSEVGRRLKKALEEAASSGNSNTRLAVASLIGEMGPTVRSLSPEKDGRDEINWAGFTRTLTPLVLQLVNDRDLDVRRMALRALGNINAEPRIAVPVFQKILENPRKVDADDVRLLAAGGLLQMVKVGAELHKRGATKGAGVFVTTAELIDTTRTVVQATSAGLKDSDYQVRTLALDAIQVATGAFGDLPGAFEKKEFPPSGRPLTETERKLIRDQYDDVQKRLDELKPLLQALAQQGAYLDRALIDGHRQVRESAARVLEQISHMRLRMKQRTKSLPELEVPRPKIDEAFDKMILGRLPAVRAVLSMSITSSQTRRELVEYIENLEDQAAPAIDVLIQRLADPDRYIRWPAARAIGNLPADKGAAAVPALAMRVLAEEDLSVRMAVVHALEGFGPNARGAVDALSRAIVSTGDAEFRAACIYALASIGTKGAESAIPNLIRALSDLDPLVRRPAAEVLGKFGPAAASAVPALRLALGDDDAEVRTRASDSILNILTPPKR